MLNFENLKSQIAVWLKKSGGLPAVRANQNQSRITPGLEDGYITYLITSVNQIGYDEGIIFETEEEGHYIGHLEMVLSVQVFHRDSLQIGHNILSSINFDNFKSQFHDQGFSISKYGSVAAVSIFDSSTLLDKTIEQRSNVDFIVRAGYKTIDESAQIIQAVNAQINFENYDGSIEQTVDINVDKR